MIVNCFLFQRWKSPSRLCCSLWKCVWVSVDGACVVCIGLLWVSGRRTCLWLWPIRNVTHSQREPIRKGHHNSDALCRKSCYVFSFYPRFLRLRIQRDIHCINKNYFEPRVEIYLGKKVMKSQTWPNFEQFPIVRFRWNLLHRFISGWHLCRLHFFFLRIPLPPSLPFPQIYPLGFEQFSNPGFWTQSW